MALKVKSEKVKTKGKIWVLLFFFVMLLIVFAILLVFLLLMGGYNTLEKYAYFYTEFSPLTILLPFIIALTTALSHKTSLMHITPANSLNIPLLKEFFITKANYRIVEERDGFIKFERKKVFQRILWLNIDKPTIEVKENEVQISIEKHSEAILTPLLVYGKKFDLHAEG
jgi:hypothetical protein